MRPLKTPTFLSGDRAALLLFFFFFFKRSRLSHQAECSHCTPQNNNRYAHTAVCSSGFSQHNRIKHAKISVWCLDIIMKGARVKKTKLSSSVRREITHRAEEAMDHILDTFYFYSRFIGLNISTVAVSRIKDTIFVPTSTLFGFLSTHRQLA